MLGRSIFCAGMALAAILPLPVLAQTDSIADTASPICTDRPTKSNYACTVDAGHFQYEADIVNASRARSGGTTTDTWLAVNPTIKYGLNSAVDLEANFSPLESVRTTGPSAVTRTATGVSDLYLRLKYQFLNAGNGDLQATLLPYVKLPTAPLTIGNGAVEGGVLIPVNYKVTDTLTLTTVPEFDADKNTADYGRHVNTSQLINLGLSLPHNFTLYGELWGDWNFDPGGAVRQYSADAALAYGISNSLQIDAGVNFGLNRNTPTTQIYMGISQKF